MENNGKHIHKYKRVKFGPKSQYWIMQCQDHFCNHYIQMATKLSAPRLMGKLFRCNGCDEPAEFDIRSIRQAKPTCLGCVKSLKKAKIMKAEDFFQELERKIAGE